MAPSDPPMLRVLSSRSFLLPFAITLVSTGLFFAWELGYFQNLLPSLPPPPALPSERLFTVALTLLLSLDAGLVGWQFAHGSCPTGVRRATGTAGVLGALSLLCPACLLLPASVLGIGVFFSFLAPFLPLLRVIAIVVLLVASWMLWPSSATRS